MSFGPKVKEWDSSLSAQRMKARGSYDANSDYAAQFESFDSDGESRVDDGEGWRTLAFDKPPKNAEEYKSLVNEWSDAGFDVRAIDMDGDNFEHSNIAVRIGGKKAPAAAQAPEGPPREMSERLKTAKERVKSYEDRAWSGEMSEQTYNPQGFLEKYKTNFIADQKSKQTPTTAA